MFFHTDVGTARFLLYCVLGRDPWQLSCRQMYDLQRLSRARKISGTWELEVKVRRQLEENEGVVGRQSR